MLKRPKTVTPQQALERLVTLCNASEQCSGDMLKKLALWRIPRSDADKIMDRLYDTRLVDDRRFAGAYARDKMRYSLWGRRKIATGLFAKRVDRQLIAEALAQLDEEEYRAAARRVTLSALSRAEQPLNYEAKMKVMRHCVSRGFEPALIADLIREIIASAR